MTPMAWLCWWSCMAFAAWAYVLGEYQTTVTAVLAAIVIIACGRKP